MKKLYEKKPVLFAVIWIVLYVVIYGSAGIQTEDPAVNYLLQIAVGTVMTVILMLFAKKNGLLSYWGFTGLQTAPKKMLYFVPMFLAMLIRLCTGFGLVEKNALNTVLSILTIGIIGPFLEELILRSMLFRAIGKTNRRRAFWIAALSFGIGHLANLAYGQNVAETLLQVVFACCIGFCFTAVLYTGKSIWPTVIAHMLNNSLNHITNQNVDPKTETVIIMMKCLAVCAYGGYVLYVHHETHPLDNSPLPEA